VYSFASISADGLLEPWVGSWDEVDKYKEFNKVKERSPGTKTMIAVTEGIFYGAGMNPVTFHEVAETTGSRMAFAQSVVAFLELYEFDGIDIDWESPLDRDKGGGPENFQRFVSLVEEIRAAFDKSGKEFLLTVALPPNDWELLDYDVIGMADYVDWFNFMSFDYHTPKNIPKTVGAHSDLKLIDYNVKEMLKESIPTKFVLGMAAYGRTYTLADDGCKELGCPFRSPGLGGCANTRGFLPFNEIHDFIQNGSFDEMHQDVSSSSMVAVVDDDQMISFDDESTWAIKEDYAEMMCLRGTMLWSIDMLEPGSSVKPQTNVVEKRRSLAESATPSGSCDICGLGTDMSLDASRRVTYAGQESTCGEISDSLLLTTREFSSKCSIAKASLTKACCAESCQLCPNQEEMNGDTMIHFDGKQISCGEYASTLDATSFLMGTEECDSSVEPFSEICCSAKNDEEVLISQQHFPSVTSCSICEKDNIHHELKSEAMVEYKGTSISCLDLNSILAKNELESSEICTATQSMLFEGCCYEKCSLCGERSLNWDATVKYNSQILACDELSSMFTLGSIREGSDQCDAMQSAYASTCCFKPPEQKCNLCGQGSTVMEVNTGTFVKTRSSSMLCTNLASGLADREEEGSEVCEESKSAYSERCCSAPSASSPQDTDASYYDWLTDHMTPSSAPPSKVLKIFFGSFILTSLLFIF
jgi:chitinase